MSKPRRPHRKLPYFKVQVFAEDLQVWRDERGAFDTVEEAREYIATRLPGREVRIMHVHEKGRHPLDG